MPNYPSDPRGGAALRLVRMAEVLVGWLPGSLALIMLAPILIPLAQKFGIDLVHLGLIMVINLSFGLTTPPVGTALFVACKVGNIAMEKLIPPLLPQLACMLVLLLAVTYMPEIYWWLPRGFGLVK